MITVVDYGAGNTRSVMKALAFLGVHSQLTSDVKEIDQSDLLVIPGQGAFGSGMRGLQKLGLVEGVKRHLAQKKPFLGICLGLQLLFESSEEEPGLPGLGVFPGHVKKFVSEEVKIPHMGWNIAQPEEGSMMTAPAYYYFVHSYYVVPDNPQWVLAKTAYGRESFVSAVATPWLLATQFHPEKSGASGLALLKQFVSSVL